MVLALPAFRKRVISRGTVVKVVGQKYHRDIALCMSVWRVVDPRIGEKVVRVCRSDRATADIRGGRVRDIIARIISWYFPTPWPHDLTIASSFRCCSSPLFEGGGGGSGDDNDDDDDVTTTSTWTIAQREVNG